MADLPGNSVSVCDDEWGTMCHTHPEIEAVNRIVGETDSFGSEYINMCQPCYDAHIAAKEARRNDESQWEMCKCGRMQPELTAWRDPEEGSSGPVYHTCSGCRQKVMDAFCSDFEDDDDYDDDYDDYDPNEPTFEGMDLTAEHKDIIIKELKDITGLDFEANEHNGFAVKDLDERKANKCVQKVHQWRIRHHERPEGEMAERLDCTYVDVKAYLKRDDDRQMKGRRENPTIRKQHSIADLIHNSKVPTKLSKEFVTPLLSIRVTVKRWNVYH